MAAIVAYSGGYRVFGRLAVASRAELAATRTQQHAKQQEAYQAQQAEAAARATEAEAREAEASRQRAVALAEQTQRETLAANERQARQLQLARSIHDYRQRALAAMEQDLLSLVEDGRRRQLDTEFFDNPKDDELIYQQIRNSIAQARVPEFGLLRRSMNLRVTLALGDRSCLPPEPTDEQLIRRQMPSLIEAMAPGI